MGGAYALLLLLTLPFFCLPTIHTTSAHYPVSVSGSNLLTMAIQTRTSNAKALAAKADVPAAIHKPRRKTRSSSQSPTGKSVTAHLAALNLPGLRFDGALTILGRDDGRKDDDDGRDLEVPVIDTPDAPNPPDSPVGVEDGISATPIDKPAKQVVRIATLDLTRHTQCIAC